MTEKRFRVGVDSNNGVGLFDGSIRLLFIKFNNEEDAVSCENALMYQCNLMNELNDENEELKQQLKNLRRLVNESYNTERTAIGRSVLKQLLERIE